MSGWGLAGLLIVSLAGMQATNETVVRVSIDGRVSRLALEEYVARVVAGEGQPRAAEGAQEALAITARTYALANLNRHRRDGFDLCDTTHCQVLRAATEVARRAAQATKGRVLMYQGQPASVYYSALCGGHSELASQVWPGADDASSSLHEDDACRDEPAWTTHLSLAEIEKALRAAGHRGGRLREVRILQRNDSGRVTRIRVDGFTPAEMSGQDLRSAVNRVTNRQSLRSTAFDVRRVGTSYRFRGTGYGHGVGLCVIGAGRRAAQGRSADAILSFYFPNLTVSSNGARAARPPTGNAVTSSSVGDDVSVIVSAGEERERAQIVTLVKSARDQLVRATGRKPPRELRVIVHATVDAFMRATGQPWWTSGASDGGQIDLVPIAMLRQRGQLERTIRHEIAHVLIDETLERKPLWVREGAASYFADPAATAEATGRPKCPTDEELTEPVSAGAHRSALARAEACFRRALSRGSTWDRVR